MVVTVRMRGKKSLHVSISIILHKTHHTICHITVQKLNTSSFLCSVYLFTYSFIYLFNFTGTPAQSASLWRLLALSSSVLSRDFIFLERTTVTEHMGYAFSLRFKMNNITVYYT